MNPLRQAFDKQSTSRRWSATQVEALPRLRNGVSQFVRVERVHVNDGRQAVIGNIQGGRNKEFRSTQGFA
jgi:hypothetical protein